MDHYHHGQNNQHSISSNIIILIYQWIIMSRYCISNGSN